MAAAPASRASRTVRAASSATCARAAASRRAIEEENFVAVLGERFVAGPAFRRLFDVALPGEAGQLVVRVREVRDVTFCAHGWAARLFAGRKDRSGLQPVAGFLRIV